VKIARLLIANRGEIACRVIRTCRRLGVRAIAVHSDADRDALHVRLADEARAIGPAPARESYLNVDAVIAAARDARADAIHPGYGFLSENAAFAEACERAGIRFVGPGPAAIRAMGLKHEAKALVSAAGVPVVPGYMGEDQSEATLAREAARIGFPLLVKAVAGGGGKGMRVVRDAGSLGEAVRGARGEAESAFGDGRLMLEKFLERPRHVEVQVFADAHGQCVHLFERECSVQRSHQKLLEESPSPALSPEERAKIGAAAARAAAAIGYAGAGTMEFLRDREGRLHFMEMNTRLQVEHPVTEAITGIDIVKEQLRIAADEPLALEQERIACRGHAIECRINAEDPAQGFRPSPGRLAAFEILRDEGPGTVRVDTHLAAGEEVLPHYDSLIAKVIAHAPTREKAIETMLRALAGARIEGVATTIPLHLEVLVSGEFRSGKYDTSRIPGWKSAASAGISGLPMDPS